MTAKPICRLCMYTESLHNLNEMDSDKSIFKKIKFCVNLEICTDEMPVFICKPCQKKIKRFYYFKRKCLKVDQEFRNLRNNLTIESDIRKPCIDESLNPYFFENQFTNSKDTFDLYKASNKNIENNKLYSDNIPVKPERSCSNRTDINIQNSIEPSFDDKPFRVQCEVCGCVFETQTAFRKHLSAHSGIMKSFPCNFCPKRFTRAENSMVHMRSHMGIKPFICEVCGQLTTKRQDLTRHMKIHSDERSHACQNCGRCFKRSFDLYRHMQTHTGARPYRCRLCEKDYTSHSGLRKHYNNIHGKMEYNFR